MFHIIFTSDYEIHGNGTGSPYKLMVEPTYRNLDLFDYYGAKLTIMAEVAEIIRFKEFRDTSGRDTFFFNDIAEQLKESLIRGHDVQLHLHPSYFTAVLQNGIWRQNPGSYILKNESFESLKAMIKNSKQFLVELLKPVKNDYKCWVFRAGGWQMQPSYNIISALLENEIFIDSSVFKYGKRNGINNFDYCDAHSPLLPWPADINDICKNDLSGKLMEFPIYAEQKYLHSFFSLNRLYRLTAQTIRRISASNPMKGKINTEASKFSTLESTNETGNFERIKNIIQKIVLFSKKHPLKMDYNQCTGKQLINGLLNAEKKYSHLFPDIPFVIIGHSKTFTRYNEIKLKSFMEFVKSNSDRFKFSLFNEFRIYDISFYD